MSTQQASTTNSGSVVLPVVAIVIGIVLVIVGQFFLDGLADSSDTWHWIQHGVLFVGGLAIGSAALRLWMSGQRGA